MSYYRTQWFWGPATNQLVKDNIFEEEKIIGGWPDHWKPADYHPRCNCKGREYDGQVDSLKDMQGASELNGLNSTNINALGFEPFKGDNTYVVEGFISDNPWIMWGTIVVTLIVLIAIIAGVWYFMRKPSGPQFAELPLGLSTVPEQIPGLAALQSLPQRAVGLGQQAYGLGQQAIGTAREALPF